MGTAKKTPHTVPRSYYKSNLTCTVMSYHSRSCIKNLPLHLGGPGDKTNHPLKSMSHDQGAAKHVHRWHLTALYNNVYYQRKQSVKSLPHLVSVAHFWQLLRLLSSRWSRRWPSRSPCPSAEPQRCRTGQTGSSALGPSYSTTERKQRKTRRACILIVEDEGYHRSYPNSQTFFLRCVKWKNLNLILILCHYGLLNLKQYQPPLPVTERLCCCSHTSTFLHDPVLCMLRSVMWFFNLYLWALQLSRTLWLTCKVSSQD